MPQLFRLKSCGSNCIGKQLLKSADLDHAILVNIGASPQQCGLAWGGGCGERGERDGKPTIAGARVLRTFQHVFDVITMGLLWGVDWNGNCLALAPMEQQCESSRVLCVMMLA